uniref:Homeobox domain-containing protein n=1 Tax=Kalanchoe fedtschenkoi TaxID=63787 RepID=A0A7N0RIH8_KALFE
MATYFHGGNSELQTDGLHTLYLMSPNYISAYNSASSDTSQQQTPAPHQSMILLNSALPQALAPSQIAHAPPPAQSQFLTLPFAQPISADDPSRSGSGFHYNLWSGGGGQAEVSGVATAAGSHPYQIQLDSGGGSSDVFRRPAALSPTTNNQQGLALSLSSHHQPGGGGNGSLYSSRVGGGGGGGGSSSDVLGGGVEESNGVQNFIMGSKYLKAAQELLDEVVNVGKAAAAATALNDQQVKKELVKIDNNNNTDGDGAAASNNEAAGGGFSRAAAEPLSVTQRQELQMKKTKLISMLDEVEQRYRQYHHQMKIVVSSFEQVAGYGSAKSYTSLALKTISKQFRCLKDAITSQIKETSRSLGEEAEENCLGVKGEGSRLRMIDHQLRQQRALQQLGMMQHNAWRPQRGLPERAVSVLRAWLFEHFLHPYPKDSDKQMLAKQTGLTRSQVSNWFINARVRLWKPMVEEMYLEEVKDHPEQKGCAVKDANNNNSGASTSKSADPSYKQQSSSNNGMQLQEVKVAPRNQNASPADISNSTMSTTSPNASSFQAPPGFGLVGASADMEGLLQYGKGQKKARGGAHETQDNSPSSILSMDMEMKAVGEMGFGRQDITAGKFGAGYGGGGGFGAYHQLGEVGRFNTDHHHHQMNQQAQAYHHANNGSVVSLTLGLPPGENLNYFSQSMHGFDRRMEMGGNGVEHGDDFCGINGSGSGGGNSLHLQAASPHSNIGFQNMDMQNRKRYAAQLLPDFVA